MRRALGLLMVAAVMVAVFGVVVQLDVRYQRGLGHDFLAHGVRAAAAEVELEVDRGKGGDFVDAVRVVYRTADGQEIRSELTGELGDPQGADEGDAPPPPGTRYAPPLELLYQPSAPTEVMAVVDAEDHSRPGSVLLVAWLMLAGGLGGVVACWVGLSRTKVAS
ncbi:DUF3592 domain-containing protein [Kribbella lupini]|uniref:DUF3592 domain-containing protein n=1 Tax=Kribbella lupini TaxID=291602 RepID=A0ABP4LVC0_9ACTN